MGFCYNYAICMPCEPYGHTQPDGCATLNYWTQKCNASMSGCTGCTFGNCTADYPGDILVCSPWS